MYITDPHNTANKATVSSSGALSVGGTVNVGNLPAIQKVGGTVDVGNLPSTQSVSGSVTANPGLPGTPYSAGNGSTGGVCTFAVPSGKHFVIQTLSVQAGITTGSQPEALIEYTTGGTNATFYVPITDSFTFEGSDYYEATLPVDIYADPSTSVTLSVSVFGSGTNSLCDLTASGYLI